MISGSHRRRAVVRGNSAGSAHAGIAGDGAGITGVGSRVIALRTAVLISGTVLVSWAKLGSDGIEVRRRQVLTGKARLDKRTAKLLTRERRHGS